MEPLSFNKLNLESLIVEPLSFSKFLEAIKEDIGDPMQETEDSPTEPGDSSMTRSYSKRSMRRSPGISTAVARRARPGRLL